MTWIILLILAGLILFIIEVFFIPGTTVVGIVGFFLSALGVFLAYRQFGNTTGHITLAISLFIVVLLIFYAARSNAWSKLANNDTLPGKANVIDTDNINTGDAGQAISTIKPIGKARINGKNLEVRSLGEYINAGEKVEVIKISGNMITVKSISEPPEEAANELS